MIFYPTINICISQFIDTLNLLRWNKIVLDTEELKEIIFSLRDMKLDQNMLFKVIEK